MIITLPYTGNVGLSIGEAAALEWSVRASDLIMVKINDKIDSNACENTKCISGKFHISPPE